MFELEVVLIVMCFYINMLNIVWWGERKFYVCSILSCYIYKFDFCKNEGDGNLLVLGWLCCLVMFGDDIIFMERNENDVKIFIKNGEFKILFSIVDWRVCGIGCIVFGYIILGLYKLKMGKVVIFDKVGKVLKEIVYDK